MHRTGLSDDVNPRATYTLVSRFLRCDVHAFKLKIASIARSLDRSPRSRPQEDRSCTVRLAVCSALVELSDSGAFSTVFRRYFRTTKCYPTNRDSRFSSRSTSKAIFFTFSLTCKFQRRFNETVFSGALKTQRWLCFTGFGKRVSPRSRSSRSALQIETDNSRASRYFVIRKNGQDVTPEKFRLD